MDKEYPRDEVWKSVNFKFCTKDAELSSNDEKFLTVIKIDLRHL